ncbi:MAG: SpoIIE family protein phosphatase [Candidatus Ozemobacteraceae bacterium]
MSWTEMLSPRRMKWVAFCLSFFLFVAFPLGIASLLLEAYVQQEAKNHDQRIVQVSRNTLEKIVGWGEPDFNMQKCCLSLRDRWFGRKFTWKQWPHLLSELQNKYGFDLQVYLVGPESERRAFGRGCREKANLMQHFWEQLRNGFGNFSPSERENFSRFFGPDWTTMTHARGVVQKFRTSSGKGLLFFDHDPYSKNSGLIILTTEEPLPRDLIRARLQTRRWPSSRLLFVQSANGSIFPLAGRKSPDELEFIPHLFRNYGQPLVRYHGMTWSSLSLGGETYYFGFFESPNFLDKQKQAVYCILFFLAIFGFIAGFRWIILEKDAYLSIRFKLMFLFLYALSSPFMGIVALSFKTFRETRQALLDDLRKEGMDVIKAIDDGYSDELPRLQNIFREYVRLFSKKQHQEEFYKILNSQFWKESLSSIELRGTYGKTFRNAGDSSGEDPLIQRFLEEFFRNVIKRYLPERAADRSQPEKTSLNEYFIQSFLESSDIGFSSLLEAPGTLRHLVLPKRDILFFWDYYKDPRLPAPLIFVSLTSQEAKKRYVVRMLHAIEKRNRSRSKEFAVNRSGILWIPYSHAVNPAIHAFVQRVRMSGEQQSGNILWKGVPSIIVGAQGVLIPEFSFISILPETRIQRTLLELHRNILLGVVFSFALAFLLAWVLAGGFLNPIALLGVGIQAIKSRNALFRLPAFPKDELGDLSLAFNDLMENLEELHAGQLIQNELFPRTAFKVRDYRVFGISRPATHLGGDYFDYFSIDEDQFIVLIGDVSGHGVPAALVMAMSKAIVTTYSRTSISPEKLLEKLNQAIFSVMRGKRLITMGLVWVRLSDNQIRYFHHGHTFPIIWKPSGTVEFIKGKGFPIGVPVKSSTPPQLLTLQPGERLVLYTDGLVESLETQSDCDSFALFARYLQSHHRPDLESTCNAIMNEHPFFATGLPQPDDFTVVILERSLPDSEF